MTDNPPTMTFGDASRMLADYGFERTLVPASHWLFSCSESSIEFLLSAQYQDDTPLTEADWTSIRQHLLEAHVIEADALDRITRSYVGR